MYGLDAATGKVLWSFDSGGSVIDGPAIADGVVYWGSGYPKVNGTANNKVYAFSMPHGRNDKHKCLLGRRLFCLLIGDRREFQSAHQSRCE